MGKAPRVQIRRIRADFSVLQKHRGEEKRRWVRAELGEAAASPFPAMSLSQFCHSGHALLIAAGRTRGYSLSP